MDNSTPLQSVSDLVVSSKKEKSSEGLDDILELEKKVDNSGIPDELRDKAKKMIKRLKRMATYGSYSGEFEIVEKYIESIALIPWGKYSQDDIDLTRVRKILDINHYGID